MELAISTASSKVRELDERDDGAEDFFAGDAHGGRDAGEDRGLEEGAVGVGAAA